MKRLKSLLYLALSVLVLGSCNKNDGPGEDLTAKVKATTGMYKGDLTVTVGGTAMPAQTQKIHVTANTTGTAVKLEIKNFSFSGLPIGDIVLDEVPAVYKNGQVVLSSKQTTLSLGDLGAVDITLSEGAIADDRLTLTLSIYQQSTELEIGVTFDGSKTNDTDDGSEEVQGTTGVYKGYLTVTVGDATMPEQKQKIYVTANNSGTAVKLEIKNFSFSGLPVGDIVLDEVPASFENSRVVLEEKQATLTFDNLGEVNVTLTEGNIFDGVLTLALSIYQPSTDLQIGVTFDGTKMAEDQSSEALITGFSVTGSDAIDGEPVLDGSAKTITIRVNTSEAVKISPTLTISEGATVEPASGAEIDLSQPIEYVVTSEDGTVQNKYRVLVITGISATFEQWNEYSDGDEEYQKFPIPGDANWATSNQGLMFVKMMGSFPKDKTYSVMPVDDGYTGKGAVIHTYDTNGSPSLAPGYLPAIPKITAGSLFTGTFNMSHATTDPLNGTKFGSMIYFQPKAVSGYYKYTPGATFYRCDNASQSNIAVEDASQADKMSIKVVLYEVSDPSETLTGHTLNTNDSKVIARGELISGTPVAEYTPFNIALNYTGTYDSSKSYKLAIVCSSSYLGDQFSGAPGSTLYIDEIQIEGME